MAITSASIQSIEDFVPIQDKIRIFLGQYGHRDVPVTVKEIGDALNLGTTQVYQGIKRLQNAGEISLEKENLSNGREKIVAIRIVKLEPSTRTYRRAADRAKSSIKITHLPKPESDPSLPLITDYLHKKLVAEELRERAISGGLDADVIQLDTNEYAEEAIQLLQKISDLQEEVNNLRNENRMLKFDLEAEQRNVATYKSRLKEETREMLLAQA